MYEACFCFAVFTYGGATLKIIYVLVVVNYCLYDYVYKVSRLTIAPSLQTTVVLAVLNGATGAENDVTTVAPHCVLGLGLVTKSCADIANEIGL